MSNYYITATHLLLVLSNKFYLERTNLSRIGIEFSTDCCNKILFAASTLFVQLTLAVEQ